MQHIAQRIGIFVKLKKKNRFKTRFFVIDNQHNLLYTSNQAFLEKVIKKSETISEIIYKCSSKKKINIKKAKVGPMKMFYTLDQIPLANKNCFELTVENAKDNAPLVLFSYQDEQIFYLHDFLKNYDSYVEKIEKAGFHQVNPIRKIHSAYLEEEKDPGLKTDNSSQPSRDEEDLRERFKILSKIIAEIERINESNEKQKIDGIDVFEDLRTQKIEAKNEEQELVQLANGNSFSGKTRNGRPHGQGTEFLKDSTSYVGEFRNGKWHGVGYMVNSNLDMTYAEFIDGRPVGI